MIGCQYRLKIGRSVLKSNQMNVMKFGKIWFSCIFYWKCLIEFGDYRYLIKKEINFVSFVINKIVADQHCVLGHMIVCENSFFEFSTYITGGEYGKKGV